MSNVAILILNWNGKKHLETFLPSVMEHSNPADVIVIDNASSDDSLDFLATHYPSIQIISNPKNNGYAGGYNAGIEQLTTTYDYFILLNNDIEVTPGWVLPILELFEQEPELSACQPVIRSYVKQTHFEYAGAAGGFIDKHYFPFCRGRIVDHQEEDTGQYAENLEIFWATGACLCIKADVFKSFGGFDEAHFAHMEEIDLCWRMQNQGHRIRCCTGSVVYHLGGGTLQTDSPFKVYLNFRNSLFNIYKNHYYSNLFLFLLTRMILDGIAGTQFLMKGKVKLLFAVLKAHGHFYTNISRLSKQRKELKPLYTGNKPSGIRPYSMLWKFFVQKKRTFSEMDQA